MLYCMYARVRIGTTGERKERKWCSVTCVRCENIGSFGVYEGCCANVTALEGSTLSYGSPGMRGRAACGDTYKLAPYSRDKSWDRGLKF